MKQSYIKYLRGGTGPTYKKVFDMIEKDLLTKSKDIRVHVNKTLIGELDITTEFLKDMTKAGATLGQIFHFASLHGETGKYLMLKKALDGLTNTFFGTTAHKTGTGWSPDHSDISMVGIKLVVVYDALVAILTGIQEENRTSTGRKSRLSTQRMQGKTATYAGQTLTVKQIEASLIEIQNLIGLSAGLSKKMKTGVVFSPADYAAIREDYLMHVKYDLTATKQKMAESVDGQPLVKLVMRDKFENSSIKGSVEKYLGHAVNKQVRGRFSKTLPKGLQAKLKKTERQVGRSLHKIKGSKAQMDELVKETAGKLTGKPYKRKPSSTTLTSQGKKKSGVKKVDSSQLRMHKQAMMAKQKFQEAIVLIDQAGRKGRKEGGASTEQKELAKLKNQINKKLPAQVRRNMGFPRLTNRTGIFSNSARVISLRNTNKGISGEYGYMLTGGGISKNKAGVYETFENTGSRQWRQSYNPKPLIAKSIRDLAVQYTDQKFVSLRRD
tara:strand:+ start:277 stop:1761 length:1485 start_codon:yes stop_codon:yes gene_type:complete